MADLKRRALIADDEPLARALVREFLAHHAGVEIVAEAADGMEAARAIQELAPDLVFLDIQMPRLTGLEVLQLTGLRQGVVFTTAHEQHALAAFNLHAVDYLLKPFSRERFDAALERASRLRGEGPAALERLVAARALQRVLVREGSNLHVLALDEVDYIEAQADHIAFHHKGRVHLKAQRLAEIEGQLDPHHFVRVHRSFIVNLRRLEAIERTDSNGYQARLQGGKRLPVSRRGHQRLLEMR